MGSVCENIRVTFLGRARLNVVARLLRTRRRLVRNAAFIYLVLSGIWHPNLYKCHQSEKPWCSPIGWTIMNNSPSLSLLGI